MCEACNNINKSTKFKDRQINTADYDRVLIIGQKVLISGKVTEFINTDLVVKGGGPSYKVAQMLSSLFNDDKEILQIFEMAKELMPIMKQKTM